LKQLSPKSILIQSKHSTIQEPETTDLMHMTLGDPEHTVLSQQNITIELSLRNEMEKNMKKKNQ